MIDNRFLHYKTKNAFLADLNQYGESMNDKIVFIRNTNLIWTHGQYYGGTLYVDQAAADMSRVAGLEISISDIYDQLDDLKDGSAANGIKQEILTLEEYDALSTYDNNTLYFIVDSQNISWTFGKTFPITFGTTFKFGGTFPIKLT